MTATGHALVGAALATKISNPLLGIPIAVFSHFLCDKVPHWDPMVNKAKSKNRVIIESVFDVILSFVLVTLFFLFLFPKEVSLPYLFVMAFAAQLPDWLEIPHFLFNVPIPLVEYNYKIQKWFHDVWFDSRLDAPWGIITQVVVVSIFVFWALA